MSRKKPLEATALLSSSNATTYGEPVPISESSKRTALRDCLKITKISVLGLLKWPSIGGDLLFNLPKNICSSKGILRSICLAIYVAGGIVTIKKIANTGDFRFLLVHFLLSTIAAGADKYISGRYDLSSSICGDHLAHRHAGHQIEVNNLIEDYLSGKSSYSA